MTVRVNGPDDEQGSTDIAAVRLMLSYLEAECRRLGVVAAAEHLARAALLVPPAKPLIPSEFHSGTPCVH